MRSARASASAAALVFSAAVAPGRTDAAIAEGVVLRLRSSWK